jgi:hypothetical protein
MIGKVKFTVGNAEYTLEIEGSDDVVTLHKLIALGNPPTLCDVCGKQGNVSLDTNKDKDGNTYINVKCDCSAKAKLGQYKAKGYFWHKFEKYNKNGVQPAQAPADN